MQTCVLSPRWRSLWQILPCVNAEFFQFCDYNRSEEEITRSETVFKKFVNHLLSAGEPSCGLDKFWLRYSLMRGDDVDDAN